MRLRFASAPRMFSWWIVFACAAAAVHAAPIEWVSRLPPLDEAPPPISVDEPSVDEASTDDPSTGDDVDEAVAEAIAPPWYAYDVIFDSSTWETSFEFGINGTTGNSESMSFRTGADTKHKTDGHTLAADFSYARTQADGKQTQHNAWTTVRGDWDVFNDSLWSLFIKQRTEYDEFKAFDVRVSCNAGLGYFMVKEDDATFKLRFGGGFSQEIGGPADDAVAEAVFGSDIEAKLTDRQKIVGSLEYLPEWEHWDDFRMESKFSWAIQLDAEKKLSLKLSVTDRYDSTPQGDKPNDLDYALLLLWKL